MQLYEDLWVYEWTSFSQNNCNTYVLGRNGKGLVDPGHSHLFDQVLGGMAKDGLDWSALDLILATHSHPDHFEGVDRFVDKEGVKIALHPEEEAFFKEVGPQFAMMMGLPVPNYRVDNHLAEGELTVDGIELQVFHTPGHSPGHVCLYWPERKVLFSGDLIFNQGVGRTDFPGGSGRLLKESIQRMRKLDIEIILSGHGGPVQGKAAVERNFNFIERVYFSML